ncbi:MAG: hypothetical protein Pg6C_08330 [Treponemataceae bacterium]|nr:MAG: hypothetical protein Pg6C_08330 [Treponemataceae bacterium]
MKPAFPKFCPPFKSAQTSGDPRTMLLSESSFLEQEFQFCGKNDASARNSLAQAIQSFEDAFRCLKTAEDPAGYRALETGFPSSPKYRYQVFPATRFILSAPPIGQGFKTLSALPKSTYPAAERRGMLVL